MGIYFERSVEKNEKILLWAKLGEMGSDDTPSVFFQIIGKRKYPVTNISGLAKGYLKEKNFRHVYPGYLQSAQHKPASKAFQSQKSCSIARVRKSLEKSLRVTNFFRQKVDILHPIIKKRMTKKGKQGSNVGQKFG